MSNTQERYASKANLQRFKSNYDTEIASAIAAAVAAKIAKIASATGSKIAITTSDGEVSESNTAVSDLATNAYVGSIPAGASATTIVGYITEAINAAVSGLGSVFTYKGVVATVADLPSTGNTVGDVYHVTADSAEYSWFQPTSGDAYWEELGTVIDLSDYSTTSEVNGLIEAAIQALDSTASQSAGADGLALSITIVDGEVTSISGSIAANTYDSYGSASTAQTNAINTVVGESTDTASASTVYGAKAYADNSASTAASGVVGTSGDASTANTVYGAKAYADGAAAGVVGQSGDASTANTVYGAKAYADSLGSSYATSAQGAKADTALQPADIEPLTDAEIDSIFANA